MMERSDAQRHLWSAGATTCRSRRKGVGGSMTKVNDSLPSRTRWKEKRHGTKEKVKDTADAAGWKKTDAIAAPPEEMKVQRSLFEGLATAESEFADSETFPALAALP